MVSEVLSPTVAESRDDRSHSSKDCTSLIQKLLDLLLLDKKTYAMDCVCAYFWSALFLLLLLARPSSSRETTSRPRKLLQVEPTSIAAIIGPTCPQGVVPCSVPPCSLWPCLTGWAAVNDYCTCRCNCTSPPGLAGGLWLWSSISH